MENTIEFKGPYNINDKDSYQNDLEKLNEPGIYIWGFMVDSNYNPINCKNIVSFSPEKMKFLPYYVGMATGKSNMTIYKRLNKHKKVSEGDASKYLRISKPFLKSFFKDEFPIHYDGDKKYCGQLMIYNIKNNNRAISYFNNPMFMFHLYQNKLKSKLIDLFYKNEPNQLPITLDIFKDCNIIDPLNDIVNNKLNFWFCYAEKKITDDKDITPFYESLESLTYFSLKGKTISKVKRWKGVTNGYKIKDETNTNIFKIKPSEEFPGY
jgi:hypothetical protein